MMENYIDRLFSLRPGVLDSPKTSIPYGRLVKLASIDDRTLFELTIKKLAMDLPFITNSWPGFADYVEDWFVVELSGFRYNLRYCERGGSELRSMCTNGIDLFFEIMRLVAPGYTPVARSIAAGLDRFTDQRLLIWLRMSSEVYHMYQVNEYFGLRAAVNNVTWMCQELVRMGVFPGESSAFESEEHMLKGLMVSGMPQQFAGKLIRRLKDA